VVPPAEAIVGFLSGLIGATGPLMNTYYLNAGITKERLEDRRQLALFGLAAGAGALASNLIARRLISKMPEKVFRGLVVAVMAVSGNAMIWQQRNVWLTPLIGVVS
jgi:uncharacterized membrane protein YfcA